MFTEAPDVGTTFNYRGGSYRVRSWIKPIPDPGSGATPHGPDRVPLMFCSREDAVYVSGAGPYSVIARIEDIEITGAFGWSEALESERRMAELLAANKQYIY